MLRGNIAGRVPFALVAVLLLLSAGLGAMYAAKLAGDGAARRMQEERLDALSHVADLVHEEVRAQAEQIALRAIAHGTEGVVNETRMQDGFRAEFTAYLASHFPRMVRSIAVIVGDADAALRLVTRTIEDLAPSTRTRLEVLNGTRIETPDGSAPEELGSFDRVAYFEVQGFVNYTLTMDRVTIHTQAALRIPVRIPAPLMEAKLEQVLRAGEGDLLGVGRTVKAILASVVQYRVLNGVASVAHPQTTTHDVLTSGDVELAVNLAILMEEIRRFRTYDRAATDAIDAAHPRPEVPEGLLPATEDRTLARLLDVYARNGTVDAVDLFALYEGIDAEGLSFAAVLAQAVAALADDFALKSLDYFGLMPLADFFVDVVQRIGSTLEDFWNWIWGNPSREAEYVRKYLRAVFVDTGIGTAFFGPTDVSIPNLGYDVPTGNGTARISVPEHAATVPFPVKDLLTAYDWAAYFPRLKSRVGAVDGSLRTLVNDVSLRIAQDAVLSGLLGPTATGPLDPKDDVSFLDALEARVGQAVDDALAWLRSDPHALVDLMSNLWDSIKAMLQDLVDYLISSYDQLADTTAERAVAHDFIVGDVYGWGQQDPDFSRLDATQRLLLRAAIDADVTQRGLAQAALDARRASDVDTWRLALALVNETPLPGSPDLRAELRQAVVGAAGWLTLAAGTVREIVAEAAQAQDVGAYRARYAIRSDPFVLGDPWNDDAQTAERFRVRHTPGYLRWTPGASGPGLPSEGELRIEIVDPATLPPTDDSPNVHYTRPLEHSRRPFSTHWTVGVVGAVRLRVETVDRLILGREGLEPAAVEGTWPLNFTVSFHAYSGWNLTGVAYRPSNTLWSDILSFVERVWDDLVRVVRWLVGLLSKALEVVREFVERLVDFAYQVVRWLSDVFSKALDLLHAVVEKSLDLAGVFIDAARAAFGAETRFTLPLYGLSIHVLVNGRAGRAVVLDVTTIGNVRASFLDLAESEFQERAPPDSTYGVLVDWGAMAGPLSMATTFDPLMLGQSHMVVGNASWQDAWSADFVGPEWESASRLEYSFGFTIPTPYGIVDVKAGASLLVDGNAWLGLPEALARSVAEALGAVGPPETWEAVGRIVRAIGERIQVNILDALEKTLLEAALFVQVDWKEAVVGLGARLSLVADGTAIRLVVEWIIDSVAAYFDRGPDPLAPVDYERLVGGLAEHTRIRLEGHFVVGSPAFLATFGITGELRAAARVEPNVAALGLLFGQDWGMAEIEFGLLVDGSFQIPGGPGAYGALWLLHGVLVPA